MYNPQACEDALEQAIVRAVPWIVKLGEVFDGTEAVVTLPETIIVAPIIVPGDSGAVWRIDPTRPARDVLPGSLHREYPGEHLDKSLGCRSQIPSRSLT